MVDVLSLGVQDSHQHSEETAAAAKQLRLRAVERLWNLTVELNVLYQNNWTALADREMLRQVGSIGIAFSTPLDSLFPSS